MIWRSAPNQLKSQAVRVNGISAQILIEIYPILNFEKLLGGLSRPPIYSGNYRKNKSE